MAKAVSMWESTIYPQSMDVLQICERDPDLKLFCRSRDYPGGRWTRWQELDFEAAVPCRKLPGPHRVRLPED